MTQKLYFKNGDGSVSTMDALSGDLNYWKGQGWLDTNPTSPASTPAPAPANPAPVQPANPAPVPTSTPTDLTHKTTGLNTTPLGNGGVNALFQLYYKRNATPEELQYWANKSDAQLRPNLVKNQKFALASGTKIDPNAPLMNDNLANDMAGAGLSPTDYINFINNSTHLNQDEINKIYSDLGIDKLSNEVFSTPTKDETALYNEAYDASGLGDLKNRAMEAMNKANELRTTLNQQIGAVNDNPWLSEASRKGRVARLTDLAMEDIKNYEDQANQFNNLYKQGLDEVHNKVAMQLEGDNNNKTILTSKLNYLLQKAEQNIGVAKDAALEKAYQSLPSYIKNLGQYNNKTKVIGSPTTGYYAYNSKTQQFEEVITPKKGSGGSGGGSGSGTGTPNFTPTEKKKLEQHFGKDWNKKPRQELLDYLYGKINPDQQVAINDIKAITGADGKVAVGKMIQIRNNIAQNAPELLKWFDSNYSPKKVLNPQDQNATKYYMSNSWNPAY